VSIFMAVEELVGLVNHRTELIRMFGTCQRKYTSCEMPLSFLAVQSVLEPFI